MYFSYSSKYGVSGFKVASSDIIDFTFIVKCFMALSMSAQLFSTHIFWLNNCCIDFVPIALYLYGCICIFLKTAATFWLLISTGQIDASLEQGVEAMRTLILGGFTNKITRFNLGQKYKYHKVWIQEKGIAERGKNHLSKVESFWHLSQKMYLLVSFLAVINVRMLNHLLSMSSSAPSGQQCLHLMLIEVIWPRDKFHCHVILLRNFIYAVILWDDCFRILSSSMPKSH